MNTKIIIRKKESERHLKNNKILLASRIGSVANYSWIYNNIISSRLFRK